MKKRTKRKMLPVDTGRHSLIRRRALATGKTVTRIVAEIVDEALRHEPLRK
jgi:hypothetical protein